MIFGVLRMNHVSQHAFEAAGRGNVVAQFPPDELKFNATPTQKRRPVRNAWLFIGTFNRFSLWSSEHA